MRSGALNVGLMKTDNYVHKAGYVQHQFGTLKCKDQTFCLLERNGLKESL